MSGMEIYRQLDIQRRKIQSRTRGRGENAILRFRYCVVAEVLIGIAMTAVLADSHHYACRQSGTRVIRTASGKSLLPISRPDVVGT